MNIFRHEWPPTTLVKQYISQYTFISCHSFRIPASKQASKQPFKGSTNRKMATSSIELSKLCKLATLPERNAAENGAYIIRSNCYKIIGPLTTARVSTGISLKFLAEGIIGRLSTSESTVVQSKLMVAVENLRQGHIQVILLNTSATCEASIVPGTVIGEPSFHHAVSPLLYWREELQKNGASVSLGEGKRQAKAWKPKRNNRCDNVSNWRMSRRHTTTKPDVITIAPQPEDQTGDSATSEVWDPPHPHNSTRKWKIGIEKQQKNQLNLEPSN